MSLFSDGERALAEAVSELVYCNPFLPRRLELEHRALGSAYVESPPVWSLAPAQVDDRANVQRLRQRVAELVETVRGRLLEATRPPGDAALTLYEDLVLYHLYERCREPFYEAIRSRIEGGEPVRQFRVWRRFRAEFEHYRHLPGLTPPSGHEPAHVFACYYQIRRAFDHIFQYLVGGSMPAAELRAAVWQSIFTYDLRRYYRGLYKHMVDYPTLITGESGTGKELVARAIGRSRYIPFDPDRERFEEDFAEAFFPLNPAALSPTLIESELFGHKRGAFTGAVSDRQGWLEACPPLGTVFLDEVAELEPALQVKLLRVIQDRTFHRLGETATRTFHGKIIAATNRQLSDEIQCGNFRSDLYYRLCADLVRAPSLREQLADRPADLATMVRFIAHRVAGGLGVELAAQLTEWIQCQLSDRYPWHGNFRELEQCVRNLIIRGSYSPAEAQTSVPDAIEALSQDMRAGALTAEQLLQRYCTWVYQQSGSYSETARRLDLDRRTVASRVQRSRPGHAEGKRR